MVGFGTAERTFVARMDFERFDTSSQEITKEEFDQLVETFKR